MYWSGGWGLGGLVAGDWVAWWLVDWLAGWLGTKRVGPGHSCCYSYLSLAAAWLTIPTTMLTHLVTLSQLHAAGCVAVPRPDPRPGA